MASDIPSLGQFLLDTARGDQAVRVIPRSVSIEMGRRFMERVRPELDRLREAKRISWARCRHVVLD